MNTICYQPNYSDMTSKILSEFEDFDSNNIINNIDLLKFINIIFFTKAKPDIKYSRIYINGKYYMNMSVYDIISYVNLYPEGYEFVDELMRNIIPYLPIEYTQFVHVMKVNPKYKLYDYKKRDIYNGSFMILDNLDRLDLSLKNNKNDIFYTYEKMNLHTMTILLRIPEYLIYDICKVTNNYECHSEIYIKDGKYFYDEIELNKTQSDINENRVQVSTMLFNNTKNSMFLSKDFYHKVIFTRTIDEWYTIINIFKDINPVINELYNFLKNYRNIFKVIDIAGGDINV